MIAGWQKRIKIADRSEFGWGTVNEYEDDELASDEDDAKRLEKAEKAAASKASKKRKTAPQRSGGYNSSVYKNQQQRTQDRAPLPPRAPMPSPSGVTPLLPPGRSPKMPGPCFHCGEMGHLRAFCPKLHRQQYPLSNVVQSMCVDKPELHGQQYPSSTVVHSVCVNKPRGELMGSRKRLKVLMD